MISKTRGIVFHRFNYSESSVIAKIYTEQFGLCSYLIQGARKKKSLVKANFLHPLSLVELVAYHKETSGLQKMKELKNAHPFLSIPNDISKTSIAIFLSEILFRSIKEETANKEKFDFIFNSVKMLDEIENPANFHLVFLIKLSKLLGFFPHSTAPGGASFFDLPEGVFSEEKPNHAHVVSPPFSEIFFQFLKYDFSDGEKIKLTRKTRQILLEKIIDYYRLHIAGMQEIKSRQVLETVLRD